MADIFTGLIPEHPDAVAERLSHDIDLPVQAGEIVVPEKLHDEPPDIVNREMQWETNRCASFSTTTNGEVVWWQATGEMLQFSPDWNYLRSGIIAGMRGDVGRPLSSVIASGKQDGFCLESVFPSGAHSVNTNAPSGAASDAAQRKITHTIDIRSGGYDAVRTLIGQNMGTCEIATYWPIQYASDGFTVEHYTPLGRGGHARAFLFLSSRKDSQGRPYVWCANSHGITAQHRDYELWSPAAIDELLSNDPWGCQGISAMSTPAPHEVDWDSMFD